MPHISEYEVEARFIERLESLGYTFAPLNNYDDVLAKAKSPKAGELTKKIEAYSTALQTRLYSASGQGQHAAEPGEAPVEIDSDDCADWDEELPEEDAGE